MKKLLLVFFLVLSGCAEETLDPSDYDRSCEIDSDCLGYSVYCEKRLQCFDFAASEEERERIEQDRTSMYCLQKPPPLEETGGVCGNQSVSCAQNTCVVY